ncbi:MAG: DUF4340 domain-containing protein [Pseudomonadota bacterium]
MNRSVIFHSVILAVALVAAYFTWTREPSTSDDKISVLNLRNGVDNVLYEEPDLKVDISKRKDDIGTFYWAKTDLLEKPPRKPDPTKYSHKHEKNAAPEKAKPESDIKVESANQPQKGENPEVEPTPIQKINEFKGNEKAQELMENLATLEAVRALGEVPADKLKNFGLNDSKTKLTLRSGSNHRVFVIGSKTYGNMDFYVQDMQDKHVYVVKPGNLQDLKYAQYRLVDRKLHTFDITEIDRTVVSAKESKKTFVQRNRRKMSDAYWTNENSNQKRETYSNWLTKLLKLLAVEYIQQKPEGLKEVLNVQYSLGPKQVGSFRLFSAPKIATDPKAEQTDEYYAVTENTREYVKLPRTSADEIVRDLDAILKD